jgi:hypothetical protein
MVTPADDGASLHASGSWYAEQVRQAVQRLQGKQPMKITITFTEGGEDLPDTSCAGTATFGDNSTQAHDVWEGIQRVGRAAMLAVGFSSSVVHAVTEE